NIAFMIGDLMYFFKLGQAISSGNFGCIKLFLGTFTECFASSGCSNYVSECLHLIQHLKKIWMPEFVFVVGIS
ncbi:hypothetical protein CONPUDRAFT_28400, partial [Coniophora puteana RWD-64-598 SS2]